MKPLIGNAYVTCANTIVISLNGAVLQKRHFFSVVLFLEMLV